MSQKKWCMKAGMAAGSLGCRLDLMSEYLGRPRQRHGTSVREEAASIARDARALRKAVGRKVPEAAELESAAKEVAKALVPKKSVPLDEAVREARRTILHAQRQLQTVYEKSARVNCMGGNTPEIIEGPVRLAEIQAKEFGISGRRRKAQ